MKTRLLIMIVVCTGLLFLSYIYVPVYLGCSEGLQWDLSCSFHDEQQNACEQMDGIWDTDHCTITQKIFESNQLTCDPGPVLENRTCSSNGMKLYFKEVMISEDKNQQCADWFDKLLKEEKERYVPCKSLMDEDGNTVVCEPKSQGWHVMSNDAFNQTGCPLTYKDWAHLTEDNHLVHGIYSPRYEIEMEKINLDRYVPISIEKSGFDACDTFYLRITNHDNRDDELSLVEYGNICTYQPEQITRQKFVYDLEPIELPRGNYIAYLYDKDPRKVDDIEHFRELAKFYFSSHFGTGPVMDLDAIKQTTSSTWQITGRTSDIEQQVILNLYNPDDVFITWDVIVPDSDGEFSTIIATGGPLFQLSGHYKVTLQQGDVITPQISRIFDVTK